MSDNLSAGKFLETFFELRNEVKEFLMQQKSKLADNFECDHFDLTIAYLVDIMSHLNKLNLQPQGKNANLITHFHKLKTFVEKLTLYKIRMVKGTFIMFENLKQAIENNVLPEVIKTEILGHLENLTNEFTKHFADLKVLCSEFVKSSFSCDWEDVPEEVQKNLLNWRMPLLL